MKKKLLCIIPILLLLSSCATSINNNTSINSSSNIISSNTTNIDKNVLDNNKKTNLNTYITSLMNNTTSYTPSWNQEGFKGRWNYIDGVFLKSIIDLYNKTNDDKYIEFVKKYVDYYIDNNGNFINLKDEQAGYNSGELDSVCESKILFDLYDKYKENKYLKAINYTYNELMNNQLKLDDGICFAHKETYPNQVWLDGFYMYAPFLARYAKEFNKPELYELLYNQYKYAREHMFNDEKKLYYHAYSYSQIFWAKDNGCSESFWLRSSGWFISSIVDTLEYFNDSTHKEYLDGLLKEALDGILKYLNTDYNMFYQLVDKGDITLKISYSKYLKYLNNSYTADAYISNYLESSGSSLIAYSLSKGYRLGVLSIDYYNKGSDIFNGVYDKSFKNNKLNDICITAGLGPEYRTYRDGSHEYYLAEKVGSDDAKGVGPFIMSFVELS